VCHHVSVGQLMANLGQAAAACSVRPPCPCAKASSPCRAWPRSPRPATSRWRLPSPGGTSACGTAPGQAGPDHPGHRHPTALHPGRHPV